jgi:UDP-N-acetyl-alpha-D-muramoyl-L-alanyl-L-glutamate epimerase
MNTSPVLTIREFQYHRNRVFLLATLDNLQFSISIWYPGLDFSRLHSRYGNSLCHSLLFHSVVFDLQPFISAGTQVIDISASGLSVSDSLQSLWHACSRNNWAEWRYLNNIPFHQPPPLTSSSHSPAFSPISISPNRSLLLFSGGKDSLACSIILDTRQEAYDTFFVLQSKDGRIDLQRTLVSSVLKHTHSSHHHESILFEDYIQAPISTCTPYNFLGVETGFAETVSFIFKSALYAAAYDYSTIYLGNEAASDEANFTWDVTDEPVNHQWSKSRHAENLIEEYIRSHLISNFKLSSPLRDLHDPDIFSIVSSRPDALRHAHSCNINKPWCKRCSKCCYVWLSYCAYIGYDFAFSVFHENLFDVESLRPVFRSLYVGHKPFECVGRRRDVLKALGLCIERQIKGLALSDFSSSGHAHESSGG